MPNESLCSSRHVIDEMTPLAIRSIPPLFLYPFVSVPTKALPCTPNWNNRAEGPTPHGKPATGLLKRIRSNEAKRPEPLPGKIHPHYNKKLRVSTDASAAQELLQKVSLMLDRLAKKNIIHKNKPPNVEAGQVQSRWALAPTGFLLFL
jgi:small subunit ribosomal protein S20